MRNFLIMILLLAGAGGLFPRLASACDMQSQSGISIALEGTLQKDFFQAAVGDTLYVKRASLSNLANQRKDISCASSQSQDQLSIIGTMTGSMTGNHIYPTTVPGIGIRVSLLVRQQGKHSSLSALPINEKFALDTTKDLTTDDIFIKTELVKTGPVATTGHISYQTPLMVTFTHASAQKSVSVDYSFNATAPAGYCYFTTQNGAFNLPPVDANSLKMQKTMATTLLDIPYACTGAPASIEMTVYGVAEDASKGILKNTLTNNNATGVGIQILYRNMPLIFGSAISLDNLPMANNPGSIPLSARYIALSDDITAGNIDTMATIKLNFL